MFKILINHSVDRALFPVLLLVWIGWPTKAVEALADDEDVLIAIKSSFHQDQQGIHPFRVSDFYVKKSIVTTNSPWLPGQGQIPMQLGQQAQRLNTLLRERNTNAAQISLESILISPSIRPTNQSIAFFTFRKRLKSELKSEPIWIVMLFDGTIATERPHMNSKHGLSRPELESPKPTNGTTVDEEEFSGPRMKGITHGDPRAPHKSEFEIPGIQWGAIAGDNYPADLCAQEALAASYLKREKPDLQALILECIELQHYVPMRAIIARKLEVPDHLNHWQAIFSFRDAVTDSRFSVPVLLDDRMLGFDEFSRRIELAEPANAIERVNPE